MADNSNSTAEVKAQKLGDYLISGDRFCLCVDLNRPSAYGTLLVIDDQWNWVRHMIVGEKKWADRTITVGIGADGFKLNGVQRYWEDRIRGRPGIEQLVKALLYIPWVVSEERTIGKLVMGPFPTLSPNFSEYLKSFVGGGEAERVVALVDVHNATGRGSKQMFIETRRFLLENGLTPERILVFSRGNVEGLGKDVENMERVQKDLITGDDPNPFKDRITRLYKQAINEIRGGGILFDWLTTKEEKYKDLHDPSTVHIPSQSVRESFMTQVCRYDVTFGVWKAVRALVEGKIDQHTSMLPFLYAKSFYTMSDIAWMPVTGLLGLVAGLNTMRMERRLGQQFELLNELPAPAPRYSDSAVALGNIQLRCTAFEFAEAARNWILQRGQRGEDRAQPTTVTISPTKGGRLEIAIAYSQPVPVAITDGDKTREFGNNDRTAYREFVRCFPEPPKWNKKHDVMVVSFEYDPRPVPKS